MDIETFKYIEQCLRVRLPEFYSTFLANFPSALEEQGLKLAIEKGNRRLQLAIANTSQKIIQVNHDFHATLEVSRDEETQQLASKYLAIGEEQGYPNYYLVDLSCRAEGVFFYDHEQAYCEPRYASLSDFADELLEEAKIVEENSKSRKTRVGSDEDADGGRKKSRRSHFGDDPDEMGS